MTDDLEYRIAKLEVKPGDVIVFKTDRVLSLDQINHVRECIKRVLPGIQALILDKGAEISLITGDELRKRLGERESA